MTNQTMQTPPPYPFARLQAQGGAGDPAEDEIQLGAIVDAMKEGWRWPVLLGGLFAVLAAVVVLFTAPVFQASGTLYLAEAEKGQSPASAVGGISLLSGLLKQGSGMETQVEIIDSRHMIRRAILSSGINAEVWPKDQEPPSLTFAGWKLGGQQLSMYAPGADALKAFYAHVNDPALQGKTLTILFGPGGSYRIVRGQQELLTGKLGVPAVSPSLRLKLAALKDGYVPPAGAVYRLRIRNALEVYRAMIKAGAISVVRGMGGANSKESYLATVSVHDTNPFVARDLTAAIMDTDLEQTRSWTTDQAGATYEYLSRQLHKIRKALSNADARLSSYQSKSGVIAVSVGAKEMIAQLADLETQRAQAKITLYGLQQIQKNLNQPGVSLNPYLFSSKDRVLDGLATQLAQAEAKLNELRQRYTAAAPQVVEAQTNIQSIRTAIGTLVRNQENIATQQLQSINDLISQHRTVMGKYPHSELQVISLTRSSEVLGKLYMFLLEKQEEAAISKASTLTKNRVLNSALVARVPIAPNAKKDVILFAFLGAFLGLSVVLGRFLLHPGFRSDDELRQRFPFLPVYGLLPATPRVSLDKEELFTMPDPRSGYGEALRLLRGNFYLAVGEGRGQVVAMTSAVPEDGKSTLAMQLASALAQDGKRVLVIDADLRSPRAHLAFQLPQEPGLSTILGSRGDLKEAVHRVESLGIDVVTAGSTPPNPSEYLNSARLAALLTELRPQYEYIFVDTPPFPVVGDILSIGPLVDRLLTIAKIGHTPRRTYQEHLQGLLSLNKPLGLVINGIRVQGAYGYGYGYGYGQEHAPKSTWQRLRHRLRRLSGGRR